jgi:hypothetical protein
MMGTTSSMRGLREGQADRNAACRSNTGWQLRLDSCLPAFVQVLHQALGHQLNARSAPLTTTAKCSNRCCSAAAVEARRLSLAEPAAMYRLDHARFSEM